MIPGRSSTLQAMVILGLAALLLFAELLFSGRLPFPAHTDAFLPWRSGSSPEHLAAVRERMNHEVTDKQFSFHPDNQVACDAFQDGRLPLWNPYQMAGLPYLGQSLYGVFYPLNLPMFIPGPPEKWYAPLAALHFFMAGFFTYLLLKRLGLSGAAALAGGLIFMCSANMTARFHYYMTIYPMAWAPLMLYLVHKYNRDRSILSLCGLAAVSALTLLTGFQQVAAYLFCLVMVFSLFWCARDRYEIRVKPGLLAVAAVGAAGLAAAAAGMNPWMAYTFGAPLAVLCFFAVGKGFFRWISAALPVGFALCLSVGLAAVQLAPVLALMPLSMRVPIAPMSMINDLHLPGAGLIGLIMPTLLNDPVWALSSTSFNLAGTVLAGGVKGLNYTENSLYIGVLPLVLVAFCAFKGKGSGKAVLIAALCLVCVGIALGISLVILPYWLAPPFRYGDPRRALLVFSFLMSLLAAFGFERIRKGAIGTTRALVPALALVAVAVACAAGAVFACVPIAEFFHGCLVASSPEAASQLPGGLTDEIIMENGGQVRWALLHLALASALGGAALMRLSFRPGRLAIALVLLAVAVDLMPLSWRVNPPQDPEGFLGTDPSIAVMCKDTDNGPFRIYRYTEETASAARIPLPPDMTTHFQIEDVEGHVAQPLKRYFELLNAVQPDPPVAPIGSKVLPISKTEALDSPLLDLLGVRYMLTTREIPDGMGYESVHAANGIHVYENKEAFPRAFLVPSARFIEAEDQDARAESLKAVLELGPGQGLRSQAVVEGDPFGFFPAEGPLPEARVIYRSPEEVEVAFDTPAPGGLLVLTDTYYPGWKAEIDGKEHPVMPADHAFRCVCVPRGSRKVVFSFEPPEVKVGIAVSLASVALLLLASAWVLLKKRP